MSSRNRTVNQLPPHSSEAEAGVLGCALLDPAGAMPAIVDRIGGLVEAFYELRHQELYRVMARLFSEGKAIDLVTVSQLLKDAGKLEAVGGLTYLAALPDQVPSAANLPSYLGIVWEKLLARRAIRDATATVSEVMESGGVSEVTLPRMQGRLEELLRLTERGSETLPRYLKEPADFEQEFYGRWRGVGLVSEGWELPFPFPLRIRPQEVTVFTGDNGSGKSSMLGHIMIALGEQGARVCVASLEQHPSVTLWIMGRQLWGRRNLPLTETKELTPEGQSMAVTALDWLQRHVLLYDFMGITHWQDILDTFRFARARRGCDVFVVDSVMRIGIPDDDYATQGLVAARFADFAVKNQAHVFEVIHQNKGEGRGKDRVRGTKQWTDNAHNVVEIARNERKGEKLDELREEQEAGKVDGAEFDAEWGKLRTTWDSKFILHKQRFPGTRQNAAKYLWFDAGSLQFLKGPPPPADRAPQGNEEVARCYLRRKP